MREIPYISASAINQFLNCKLQFYFERVLKLPKKQLTSALMIGSLYHSTLEFFYSNLMQGKSCDQIDWNDYLQKKLLEFTATENIKYKDKEDPDSILKLIQQMFLVYLKAVNLVNFEIIAVEYPFSIAGLLPVNIIGSIDLVLKLDNEYLLVENKSSAQSYSDQRIMNHLQSGIYALYASQNGFSESNVLVALDVMTKSKKTPKYNRYYLDMNDQTFNYARCMLEAVYNDMITGPIYPKRENNYFCATCNYQQECLEWSVVGWRSNLQP